MSENLEILENLDNCQIFICFVCFREQGSVSLEVFNKYVDACFDVFLISENFEMFSCLYAFFIEVNKKENVYFFFLFCEKQDYKVRQKNIEIILGDCVELVEIIDNLVKVEGVDVLSNKYSKEECFSFLSKLFNVEYCYQKFCIVLLEDEDVEFLRR